MESEWSRSGFLWGKEWSWSWDSGVVKGVGVELEFVFTGVAHLCCVQYSTSIRWLNFSPILLLTIVSRLYHVQFSVANTSTITIIDLS